MHHHPCPFYLEHFLRITVTRKDNVSFFNKSILLRYGLHTEKYAQNQCLSEFCQNISLVQFSHSVVSDSVQPHGLQHARLPYPSPAPGVCSNSCPSNQWCHPTIPSPIVPFSSHLQSSLASASFPMSQFFESGGQTIGVSTSASVLPMNIQDWSPLGWTSWISLQSKGLSRVFSNTIVQKHQFFCAQLSL